MLSAKSNAAIASSLIFAIALWGGNNTGTKWVVQTWPPVWSGATRFFCAGLMLLGLLHWTNWLGKPHPLTRRLKWRLWTEGGVFLAGYIVAFTCSLRYTSVSHVALYLGAAPVWALLWEGVPDRSWRTAQRYGAAALALTGVLVLLWPALKTSHSSLPGELLGLASSILWTNYGRQCRKFSQELSGAEVSAHTMWRAGALLLPIGIAEVIVRGKIPSGWGQLGVQAYCAIAGGVFAFAIWSNALRHWPTSQVLLFNNLIPLSTMTWAYFCLGEAITPTFWAAMVLIAAGVILGQVKFGRVNLPPTVAQPE